MDKIKTIIAAMAAIGMVILSGCTPGMFMQPTPAPTVVTVTAPAETATASVEPVPQITTVAPTNDQDAQFDALVTQRVQTVLGATPSQEELDAARKLGHATCSALNRGVTIKEIGAALDKGNYTQSQMKLLAIAIVAGVRIYCPEHVDKLTNQ